MDADGRRGFEWEEKALQAPDSTTRFLLEFTQGNQGRDLLVGGLYIRVYFDLEKLKQLTIFSFPPLSLCLGCQESVALDF